MIRSRGIALAMALCLAALAGSCSGDKGTNSDGGDGGDESPFLPRTSARNLLRNLATAYAERDSAAYDSLLAKDFRFLFAEEDHEVGDTLTVEQEHDVHALLFGSQDVISLTLSFNLGVVELDEQRSTPDDSLWTSVVTNVDLYLFGKTPAYPNEIAGYEVEDARQRFWFRKNAWTDPANREPVWTIVEWLELESTATPAASVERHTWGQIKALFLSEPKAP